MKLFWRMGAASELTMRGYLCKRCCRGCMGMGKDWKEKSLSIIYFHVHVEMALGRLHTD